MTLLSDFAFYVDVRSRVRSYHRIQYPLARCSYAASGFRLMYFAQQSNLLLLPRLLAVCSLFAPHLQMTSEAKAVLKATNVTTKFYELH
jgi:hypothetical protein